MDTGNQHIIQLLEKYSSGQANATEIEQLLTLVRTGIHDESVVSYIENNLENFVPENEEDIAFWKSRLEGGAQRITSPATEEGKLIDLSAKEYTTPRNSFLRKWGWAAASLLLLTVGGTYFFVSKNTKEETHPSVTIADTKHITPGKNGAVLTLADGSQLVLDSLGNGIVANQNGTAVTLKGGGLAYDPTGKSNGEVGYNTMTTPKGRQFQITLPDGTRVWLNAASSLKYPTVFSGNQRLVTVTGEAYFEVSRNTNMPFKVNVNGKAEVEVLGTQFNVNAYNNEAAISTTLLNGSVKLIENNNAETLKPGQQGRIQQNGKATNTGIKVINGVDLNKVMAWKNGLFNFEGASLEEIMRQVERWYDIEVIYAKNVPDIEFEGKLTRDVPLSDLLVMLEKSGIHCRIENRKLTVLP